jgi:ABC-type sugar transport system substrate-binding protein
VRVRIAVVAAVVALGSAGAAMAFTSATPMLNGSVGPGFTISLKNSAGKKVKTLKAGTYKFVITDKADIHTFDLAQKSGGKFTRSSRATPSKARRR